jgi:hypothetical protein
MDSHWASQSPVTEPGAAAAAIDAARSEILAELGRQPGLQVPPAVTSVDPNGGPPRQVDVSRALAH